MSRYLALRICDIITFNDIATETGKEVNYGAKKRRLLGFLCRCRTWL